MQTNLRDRIYNLISGFMRKLVPLARRRDKVSATSLHKVEDPLYVLGCSPTAAADIVKADEKSGNFPNIYPGIMPPDASWGTYQDNGNTSYQLNPVIATPELIEKRWISYQSTTPDPDPDWEPLEDMLRGYMHGDPSSDENTDDDTKFYTNGGIAPN